MNNNFKPQKHTEIEYDECRSHGICSISPALVAVKALVFAYLQEMAFYIKKIRALGAHNENIKNNFIDYFSILAKNSDYGDLVFHKVICNIREDIYELKSVYKHLCEKHNKNFIFFKSKIKLSQDFSMTDVIKQGQKCDFHFKKKLTDEQKKSYELIVIILKSIYLYIIELQSLNINFDKYYMDLIFALSIKNFCILNIEQIKNIMKKYSKLDYDLMNIVFETRKQEFGGFIEADIPIIEKEGKAILVSGSSLKELELVLEATKNKGINVYTHGQMITAHTLSKFKTYPHLAGHYGKNIESYITDFSTFPGPIVLTKLSLFKIENLFTTRIFTFNKITPKNTTTLTTDNFEPLIKAAIQMDGFQHTREERNIKAGIVECDYYNKINEAIIKIKKGEIKKVFTIGVSNIMNAQVEHLEKFLNSLSKDSFVISFYCETKFENVLFTPIDYTFPYLYIALNAFLALKDDYALKINVFSTRCEPHTIPNLVNFRRIGIDKIFFLECHPMFINPALTDFLMELFDIIKCTNFATDIKRLVDN